MDPVLATPRLLLYELQPHDLTFVMAMLGDPEVTLYYERTFDQAAAQAWLDRQLVRYRNDGHGLWLVRDRHTGVPVGQVGLAMQEVEGQRRPEIGWLLAREFWGRGYATEAGAATRSAAFGRWGYPEVISLIRPENLASRRVAGRLGMTPGPEVQFHGFRHTVYASRASDIGSLASTAHRRREA
jgi:RimJ/RimL family protein N-acetyltransferase